MSAKTKTRLSPQAMAILVVLQWERKRRRAVTISEITRRLSITFDTAKDAVKALMKAGLIERGVAAAYRAPVPKTVENEEPS